MLVLTALPLTSATMETGTSAAQTPGNRLAELLVRKARTVQTEKMAHREKRATLARLARKALPVHRARRGRRERRTDGKTPVKGTDYWTAADKQEIVNSVIAALPDGTEVSY